MQSDLKFPEFLHDKKAKKLIEQLLSHNPNQRHGGSFTALRNNPWFENFNWKYLVEKNKTKLPPPFIPPNISSGKFKNLPNDSTNLESFIRELESNKYGVKNLKQ